MIFLLDNYDSFSHNLVGALRTAGADVRVERCDRIRVDDVLAMNPRGVVISPGPGRPEDRGIGLDLLRVLQPGIPVLGVCLGLQMMTVVEGGGLQPSREIHHGRSSTVTLARDPLFAGIGPSCRAMRYHSWVSDPKNLPSSLQVIATTADGEIMGLRHARLPWVGVQFHPESFETPEGPKMIANWLDPTGTAAR